MLLKFTKMQALGNDFVVFDAINQLVDLKRDQIRQVADRHFGIGCDQVLLVERPVKNNSDFAYRIFNADGSEVGQCGNGARCFARFVRNAGLSKKNKIVVDINAGQLVLESEPDNKVTVNMGIPQHEPAKIPLNAPEESKLYSVNASGKQWQFGAVSLGNPHAVILVENAERAPVNAIGPILEKHPIFPHRANIGFMEIVNIHHIRLRVFERGSGETMACGSGACAATVVGIDRGLLISPVKIDLWGGTLDVQWQGRGDPVLMRGPAFAVFEGTIDL